MFNKILTKINYNIKKFLNYNKALVGQGTLLLKRKKYENIKKLQETELKIFSQNGEDGIIDFILNKIQLNIKVNFVEIGVGDYEESNTRFLTETRLIRGLIVDSSSEINFVKSRNFYWKNNLYVSKSIVSSENINQILNKYNFSNNYDLLSLDIDGIDYWVLEKITLEKVKVVILEYNPMFGSNLKLTIPNINNFKRLDYHKSYYGMSLRAAIQIMENKGFSFIGNNSICCNAFFINKKLKHLFNGIILDKIEDSTQLNFFENKSNSYQKNTKDFIIREMQDLDLLDLEKRNIIKIKNLDL